jgi:hypothetical protein
MKIFRHALVITALLVTGAAIAQVNIPNPQQAGNSMESAVRVIATNDFMVDRFIKRWIRTHYPNWNAEPHEYMQFADERYAVVYITSPESPGRRIYFRVQSRPGDDIESDPFPTR